MNDTEKKQQLFNKFVEYSFLALLFIQVCFLIYYNLSDIRYSMDHDMANGYYHFKQVIQNHTLNIPDWHHTTTLELDTTFLFATPLYLLTHDLFLASGIANIIYIALYIIVIYGIMHMAHVNRTFTFFTLTLVLTPYTFGMLDYMNMLFFGVIWYTVKTLVPLLFLWVILQQQTLIVLTKRQKISHIITLIAFLGFLFVTTVSTGVYTMMCGICPIIIYMIMDIWLDGSLKNKYNRKHLVIIIATVLVFLVGFHLYGTMFTEDSRADMAVTLLENYAINFRACVAGIFQLFGATPYTEVPVMSFDGILYCLKFGFVLLLLIAFFANLPSMIRKTETIEPKKYLTMLFFFDFVILFLSDTRYSTNTTIEYRYYLIGAVPLIILFGIQLYEWFCHWNAFQKNIVSIGLVIALALLLVSNNKNVLTNWDRSGYAVELTDYFDTLDIESVFFVDDDKTSNICRAIDDDHKYGTFMSDSQTLKLSYCSYFASQSGSFYGSKNAIAIVKDTAMTDYMPAEIAGQYTKVGTIRWFDIYTSDMVYFP